MGKHYIPQFYLRGFAQGDRLKVFDKVNARWFESQPKSVANEGDLWPDELEMFMTDEIEEPAKEVIERLRMYGVVSHTDRILLARYAAFLWKRVPAGRERVRTKTPEIADQIRANLHAGLDRVVDSRLAPLVERRRAEIDLCIEKIKAQRPDSIWHGSLQEETGLGMDSSISSMEWQVLHTHKPSFLASDNPVFFFASDGVGNPTSELSLPLSSTAALVCHRGGSPRHLHRIASRQEVIELNRRTAANATHFVFAQHVEPWMSRFLQRTNHVPTRRRSWT